MKTYIVKARERQGTSSLDLTLPADIKNEHNLSKGDVFKVEVIEKDDGFQLIYSLIYPDKPKK